MFRTNGIARTPALAAALIASLVVAACGGSGEADKSPAQILQDVAAAVKGVTSFHLSGNVTSSGMQYSLDLHVAGPQNLEGSVTIGGVKANLALVDDTAYVQGGQFIAQFAGQQAASLVGDSWVKLPADSASNLSMSFSTFTDTSKLGACLMSLPSTSLSKSTSTVNGQAAVVLTSGGDSLSVATNGPAYPLQLSGSGNNSTLSNSQCSSSSSGSSSSGSGSGSINFDGWGSTVSVTPPPNPVDLSNVGAPSPTP